MEIDDLFDGAALTALVFTPSGHTIISAYKLYLKLHNDFLSYTVDPDTGQEDYTIDIIGRMCNRSGITSNSKPKILVALCYMMLAEYNIANGRTTEAKYNISIVDNINISSLTSCQRTISDCKKRVRELKETI